MTTESKTATVFRIQFVALATTIAFALGGNSVFAQGATDQADACAQRPADVPPLVPIKLEQNGNYRIAPPYVIDSAFEVKPDVPKGQVIRFIMNSDDSEIFPSTARGRGRGGRAGRGGRGQRGCAWKRDGASCTGRRPRASGSWRLRRSPGSRRTRRATWPRRSGCGPGGRARQL